MRPPPGNDLDLGILPGRNARLAFPRTERDKHDGVEGCHWWKHVG